MTDYQTIQRTMIAERKKAATDRLCRGFAIAVVGGFWLFLVSSILWEMAR